MVDREGFEPSCQSDTHKRVKSLHMESSSHTRSTKADMDRALTGLYRFAAPLI